MSLPTALGQPLARPWKRAALWLAFLAPFFYLTYGTANWLASIRPHVGSVVFGWEHQIPFLAWTIIPYWTINAFYGLSLFVCGSVRELDTLGRRLLTAQVIAVICFILFPLRISFNKPDIGGGIPGFLFDTLAGFDKPFNQAPSLHIALLVILWQFYARHVPRWACAILHLWFLLIGASVLTTYQHHFIDVPTGALLGLTCLWLWPDHGEPLPAVATIATDAPRRRLALCYTLGGVGLAALAVAIGTTALWLIYPAISLWLVAANYFLFGASGFQKSADGSVSLAATLLLAPYTIGAWINSRIWTRNEPRSCLIDSDVSLGRIPSCLDQSRRMGTVLVDLTAELPSAGLAGEVRAFPSLDLVAPQPELLREASDAIEQARRRGPVLVCCALGYSRSAAVVATWLMHSGRAADIETAIARISLGRPRIVLGPAARSAILSAARAP